MNTQKKVSGTGCRMGHAQESLHRIRWLSSLILALALCASGTYLLWRWNSISDGKKTITDRTLSVLENRAQPYLKEAQKAVPAVVSELATFGSLSRLCRLMAQDKLLGTQTAQAYLADKLRPVTAPCRRIAGVYGATPLPGFLQHDIRDTATEHAYASLYAAGALGLELVFLKTTLRALARVTASVSARLAASWGIGTASALADGPFPIGDAVGVVLAAGGTAWSLLELKQACTQLTPELTAALHQSIHEFHETCRRSVLP